MTSHNGKQRCHTFSKLWHHLWAAPKHIRKFFFQVFLYPPTRCTIFVGLSSPPNRISILETSIIVWSNEFSLVERPSFNVFIFLQKFANNEPLELNFRQSRCRFSEDFIGDLILTKYLSISVLIAKSSKSQMVLANLKHVENTH